MAYPGPGPSSYYAHHHPQTHPHPHQQTPPPGAPGGPPPHQVYGTHSPVPGPRPTYYQYPPPGPPLPQQHHMGSPGQYPTHTPPPLPHQSLPQNARGNHRANMNGGYNRGGGGAHHYYHHHHQQQQPHYSQPQHYYPQPPPPPQQQTQQQQQQQMSQPSSQQAYPSHPHPNHTHSHIVPPPISIHPPQHLPYAPQSATAISSAKYSSYSPSLSTATTSCSPAPSTSSYMPSPSAPVFTPSWQTRQAMAAGMGMAGVGPLPKQLSMPPPVMPMAVPEFVPNGNGNPIYGVEPESINKDDHIAAVDHGSPTPVVEGGGIQAEREAEKTETKNENLSALSPAVPTFSALPTTSSLDSSSLPETPALDDSTTTSTIATSSASPSHSSALDSELTSTLTPPSSMLEITPILTITTATPAQHPTPSFVQIGSISTSVVSSSSLVNPPSASSSSSGPSSLSSTSSPQNSLSTLPSFSTLPSSFSSLSTLPIIPPNTPNPTPQWAIWSRRPQDPANAPSIIISPRARPPPDVVGSAMDLRMPVESRSTSPILVLGRKTGLPLGLGVGIGMEVDTGGKRVEEKEQANEEKPIEKEVKKAEELKEVEKEKEETSETTTATPSRTPTTTVPCSPASSHTSISVSTVPIVEEKTTISLVADPPVEQKDAISGSITPTPTTDSTDPMLAAPIPPSPTPSSSTAIPSSIPSSSTQPSPSPATEIETAPLSTPAPAPAPAPAKKSWASLFNPSASASGSTSTSSTGGPAVRNALPTSSVVGFSIPAESRLSTDGKDQAGGGASHGISASKKSELLTLLTTGPAPLAPPAVTAGAVGGGINFAAAAAAGKAAKAPGTSAASSSSSSSSVMRIRPRGLINSGNMCFANAVLQIMVYCPPFHRLFVELGRVLNLPSGVGGPSVASNGVNSNAANVNGSTKPESATPLVDATIEFLREFLDEKDKAAAAAAAAAATTSSNGSPSVNGLTNVASTRNGSGASGSGSGYIVARGGKGKEKEQERTNEDEYDWADGDAFLPSGIYDAMKTKKRFDSMRGGQQEDAEEFFGFYLDALEEELLAMLHAVNPSRQPKQGAVVEEREEAAPADDAGWLEVGKRNRMVNTRTIKTTESPITRIFGGKFRTTLRTPGQKDSVIVEDWRSLRLDIQQQHLRPGEKDGNGNVNANTNTGNGNGNGVITVQEALAAIAHPQQVQVQSSGGGAGAGAHGEVTAQQQVLIESLPQVLVLHVKRFLYDVKVGGTVKLGKQIRFGPELDIGAEIMVPAAKKSHPIRYKLFGVLYHHGLSASGGHYTLDVLHPNRYPSGSTPKTREGWVRIDDNLVSDVRIDDVFGAWEKDESRCAYLLFYRRI